MAQPPDMEQINALLSARSFGPALTLAMRLTQRTPRQGAAWFALARATFGLGRLRAADEAVDRAIRLGADGPEVQLIRAIVDHRLGRSDAAIRRLRDLVDRRSPNAVDATMALAEVLHRANRVADLQALVAAGGAWLDDPRSAIFSSRVISRADRAGAVDRLEEIARGGLPAMVRRVAGFDAVRMLDADAQYRRAFDLARHVHDTTGAAFDVEGMLADAVGQAAMLERLGKPPAARARKVEGVALVVGMPRSGTTLLEQMLDRHPDITGIGEFDGVSTMGTAIVGMGLWPRDLASLEVASAQELQRDYCDGALLTRRPGTRWTFDKSLHTWRWLPAVAAVLPGAACIRIERDARDTAISLYLSNFHPQSFGWTRSLESIRRVISAERALAPVAMRALGIPHEDFRYEDLVRDPRDHMERVLKLLGLPWHDAVLAPEANVRTVLTLSHEQVRKSINTASIGRWRNYEFAFGPGWAP